MMQEVAPRWEVEAANITSRSHGWREPQKCPSQLRIPARIWNLQSPV